MGRKSTELQRLYEAIAALTRERCLHHCPEPGGCCGPQYCDLAEERAAQFGVQLPVQAHPRLKYMGPRGCVVPAYLRPLCAVHVCEMQVLQHEDFARVYLGLRETVCRTEERLGPGWPRRMARRYWE